MTTDGFSIRDYRMYKNAGEQFVASTQYNVATNDHASPEFPPISPSVDISTFDPPQTGQTGFTDPGDPGFNWHVVVMTVLPSKNWVIMEIDGLKLGVLGRTGSAFPASHPATWTWRTARACRCASICATW